MQQMIIIFQITIFVEPGCWVFQHIIICLWKDSGRKKHYKNRYASIWPGQRKYVTYLSLQKRRRKQTNTSSRAKDAFSWMNKFRLANSLKREHNKQGCRRVKTRTILLTDTRLKLALKEGGCNLARTGYKRLRVSIPIRSLVLVKLYL